MSRAFSRSIVVVALSILIMATVAGYGSADAALFDLGGAVVRISNSYDGGPDAFMTEGTPEYARRMQVEEMFNCRIEVIDLGSAWKVTLRNSVMAGEAPADVVHAGGFQALFGDATHKFLMPLEDILEPGFWSRFPQYGIAKPEYYTVGGRLYAFPKVTQNAWPREQMILWDKTVFASQDLPNLYELVESGQWTWDTMRDIARKATKDLDGDGVKEQVGLVGGFRGHTTPWFATNNAAHWRTDANGRVVFTGDESAYIDTLQFFRTMIEEGIYAHTWGTRTDYPVMILGIVDDRHTFTNLNHEWGIVPLPTGPNRDPGDFVSSSQGLYSWVVPVTVKDARAKIEVALALYNEAAPYLDIDQADADYLMNTAINYEIQDEESLNMFALLRSNIEMGCRPHLMVGEYSKAIDAAINGEKSPLASMQGIANAAQAKLDDLFNNW
jgi:hypothetical protein